MKSARVQFLSVALVRNIAQLVELSLWERRAARSSRVIPIVYMLGKAITSDLQSDDRKVM